MKNYIFIFLGVLSISFFLGCDYEDEFTPPSYATFEDSSLDFSVDKESTASYDVTIYTSNEVGNDRTVMINPTAATTISASAFSIPNSVVIPANSNEATFTVELMDNNLNDNGGVIVLGLSTEETGLLLGGNLTINVKKICEFEIVGSYSDASEFYEATVPVEIVAGGSANVYLAKDLFAAGTDITFTINADNSITVPSQDAWVSGTYGQAKVVGRPGSALNPCTGVITLILNHTVSAGSFGDIKEVMTKL